MAMPPMCAAALAKVHALWSRVGRMADYKVFWVPERIFSDNGVQEAPNATSLINEWAAKGYEVVTVVPGTNAQTYAGLFITLKR